MSAVARLSLDTWLPVGTGILIYLARLRELGRHREVLPGRIVEQETLRWFVFAGSLAVAGGLVEFWWRRPPLRWGLLVAGWGCALGSFALRRWAISTLGRYWSLHVEIREHHVLVRAGPFRWIRHPTYLSMMLELVAAGLVLRAFGAVFLAAVLFVVVLRRRLRTEEQALVEKFGVAYQEYQRSTPALLPWKWPASQ